MKFVLLFMLLFGVSPSAAQSAVETNPCGDTKLAPRALSHFSGLFRDTVEAKARGTAIRKLNPSEPEQVVVDASTCRAVYTTVTARIRSFGGGMVNLDAPHDWVILHYGPYLLIALRQVRNDGVIRFEPSPVYVLQASDLSILAAFAG